MDRGGYACGYLRPMGKKIILTGATGYVGEGVLLECLANSAIDEVLSVGRKASGKSQSHDHCDGRQREQQLPRLLHLHTADA